MGDDAARGLTHFDGSGRARMVDVGEKPVTHRVAVASGLVRARPETIAAIREGRAAKGDVLAVAQVAAVMAAKKTADIVPMCHPLMLSRVDVSFELGEATVGIRAQVETRGQTGVEMEALTAVAVAGLALHDMVKAVDPGAVLDAVRVERKEGGKTGTWTREDPR